MKEFLKGMSLKKDWKVHLMCLILVLIADGIGKQPVGSGIMKITLLPMLYALVLGMVFAGLKIIKRDMMETASPYIGISVMFLTCRMAADIGPNLASVVEAGLPLILQEIGNIFTVFFALPVAVLIFKMGREAVGCSFSIFNSLMASVFVALNVIHPYALGMAAGTGSASMMAAALGPVVEAYPDMTSEISAYAAASQVLTNVDGLYVSLFISLPMTNFLYRKLKREKKQELNLNYKELIKKAEEADDE